MKRRVTMFMAPFAEKVAQRVKKQTVRPMPKIMPATGDLMDARKWSGKAYRSKTVKLIESEITRVDKIIILPTGIAINWKHLSFEECQDFAQKDGFDGFAQMIIWFGRCYPKLSFFDGIVIHWK